MKSFLTFALIVGAFFGGMFFTRVSRCGASCDVQFSTLAAKDFLAQMSEKDVKVIDVRTSKEFVSGHIQGAINADFNDKEKFEKFLDSLNKRGRYLVYCRSGKRATEAMKLMQEKGFINVANLEGGVLSWQAEGLPLSSQ